MMAILINYFCGMVDRQKAFNFISNRISDTPWACFEPAQNLSLGFVCSSNNHYHVSHFGFFTMIVF